MNVDRNDSTGVGEKALDSAIKDIRSAWEREALESSNLGVDDLMREIERREAAAEEVASPEAERKRRRAERRHRLAALVDQSHGNPTCYFVVMCSLGTLGLFVNQLGGALSILLAAVVGVRAAYTALRVRHTSLRVRLLLSRDPRRPPADVDRYDPRFAETPIFQQCGRFVSPGVLESLHDNLEIMRAQQLWPKNYLDGNVGTEECPAGAGGDSEEVTEPRHGSPDLDPGEEQPGATDESTYIGDGRHRRGPRPLPQQQAAS